MKYPNCKDIDEISDNKALGEGLGEAIKEEQESFVILLSILIVVMVTKNTHVINFIELHKYT